MVHPDHVAQTQPRRAAARDDLDASGGVLELGREFVGEARQPRARVEVVRPQLGRSVRREPRLDRGDPLALFGRSPRSVAHPEREQGQRAGRALRRDVAGALARLDESARAFECASDIVLEFALHLFEAQREPLSARARNFRSAPRERAGFDGLEHRSAERRHGQDC